MTPDQPRRPAPDKKPAPVPPGKSAGPTAAQPGSGQPRQGQRQPAQQKQPPQEQPKPPQKQPQQKQPPQKQPQQKQPQQRGSGTGRGAAEGAAPSRRAQATAAQPDPAPRGRTAEQAQRATSGAQAASTGGIAQATGGQRPAQKKQRTQQRSKRQRVVPARVQGDRRYRQRITHIDMWSAAKVTTCFYLSALIVMLVAGVVLWSIASAAGAIGNIEEFMQDAGFEDFRFLSGQIIRGGVLVGLAFVAIAEVLTLVAVGLYNLFAELIGGFEVTVREESRDRER